MKECSDDGKYAGGKISYIVLVSMVFQCPHRYAANAIAIPDEAPCDRIMTQPSPWSLHYLTIFQSSHLSRSAVVDL